MSPEAGRAATGVTRVLYVAKTHLDAGFTDLAAVVRRRYLEDFFPRAMQVAADLRARGGTARLRWTTGSWILTEALESAGPAERRRLEEAIGAGDLCWHALPFTLHTEFCDRSLLEHGLTLSAELDRRFGRRTRAAKVTDVPGHTRGLVSVLADAGVDFLHVGVNPAATAPAVPAQFRWSDPAAPAPTRPAGELGDGVVAVERSARPEATVGRTSEDPPEIVVMYQPGGYGALQRIEGTDTAVVVDLTGDNLGPRSADEVVELFERLGRRFPGAEVAAATLDDVAAEAVAARGALPVVTAEIGDAWIHGTASAPRTTAGFRALARARTGWLAEGAVDVRDPALTAASTVLLQVAEHTWGLDQKSHWPEQGHWSAADLAVARRREDTRRFESSWAEQFALLPATVAALARHGRDDLAVRAGAALEEATAPPVRPELATEGLGRVEPGRELLIGGMAVTLDPVDGAVIGLVDSRGRTHASPESPIGRFHQRTYDAADFERWFSTFNAPTRDEDLWWARWDNTKPGLGSSGAVSRRWLPSREGTWAGRRDGRDVVVAVLTLGAGEDDPVAVADTVLFTLSESDADDMLDLELAWFDKPAARWPESSWWTFAPAVGDPRRWEMSKLDEWVSPLDVVEDAGARLHSVGSLRHPDGVRIDLVDTGLVAPGSADLLRWEPGPVDMDGGWHVCLHANLWGTNFPMWTEGSARFRARLGLSGSGR